MMICLSKNIIHIILYINMKVHCWSNKSQKKSLDSNLVMSNTHFYILGYRYDDCHIEKHYLYYTISTGKYTTDALNHKKKSLDSSLVMFNKRSHIY